MSSLWRQIALKEQVLGKPYRSLTIHKTDRFSFGDSVLAPGLVVSKPPGSYFPFGKLSGRRSVCL